MHGSSSGPHIPPHTPVSPTPSDARLISQVAGGDRHAFEALYRGYFPRLTRFLNGMTRSVQLIEEIVNDTMLVVWQKAWTFDGSCKVSTWIFAIAYRKACKAIRGLDEPVDVDPDLFEGDAALRTGARTGTAAPATRDRRRARRFAGVRSARWCT